MRGPRDSELKHIPSWEGFKFELEQSYWNSLYEECGYVVQEMVNLSKTNRTDIYKIFKRSRISISPRATYWRVLAYSVPWRHRVVEFSPQRIPWQQFKAHQKKKYWQDLYLSCRGNVSQMARIARLHPNRRATYKLIKKYEIDHFLSTVKRGKWEIQIDPNMPSGNRSPRLPGKYNKIAEFS